jgi:hypothetical protein
LGLLIAWCIPVFFFGMLAAYLDIDSFFLEKRISYTGKDTIEFWTFLILNGLLSAAFLLWSLSASPASPINKAIQVESPWSKMIVIGFGVPLLIRSKLFSFGENQKAAGPALVYDWFRQKMFQSIYLKTGDKKDRITERYASQLSGRAGLDTQIKDWVDTYLKLFATPAQQAELDQEFNRIQARYQGALALSKEHLSKLLRWAMDNTAIDYIERHLRKLH